jgi:hypothetical protein
MAFLSSAVSSLKTRGTENSSSVEEMQHRGDAGGLFAFPVLPDNHVEAGFRAVRLADLRDLVGPLVACIRILLGVAFSASLIWCTVRESNPRWITLIRYPDLLGTSVPSSYLVDRLYANFDPLPLLFGRFCSNQTAVKDAELV